ncbi:MAG: ATP-binding protein [Chloroflexi bacterium]|nr:ATP-binding protein [Chloroflexota bacterium]
MAASDSSIASPPRLADRLAAARYGRFVGREAELELFRSALLADESPFVVLYIYGPGGVGKTTLLREYVRLANTVGRMTILLDSRNLEPSPDGLRRAWQQALGIEEFTAVPPNLILLIDTYELIAPLDNWLRHEFLPQLPPNVLIVLAGRNAPASAWRSDPGWSDLTRIIPLRNLRPEESQTYLIVRGIPHQKHAEVLAFTHGHPLALSLVADVLHQGDKLTVFNSQAEPDVVRVLLERFTQNVPDAQHRQALEICAHVRVTSEALLAALLGEDVAYPLFDWLRGLSFIQQGAQGLFPHDLARDVLDADLRWRNPQAYQALHRQVRLYYGQQLLRHGQQSSLSADLIYQNRYIAAINPFFGWETLSQVSMEPATPADTPFILETLQQHEGAASVAIARYWLQKQPEGFTVFRTAQDRQMGFVVILMLPVISDADTQADPALVAAQTFIQQRGAPVRPDEPVNYVRFWMGREKYQVAETQSLVAMRAGGAWISNPQMSWTFAATAEAARWQEMFGYFNFDYTGEADFVVGRHRYGVFTHDWRIESVAAWGYRMEALQLGLELGKERETGTTPPPLLTLSQPEFIEAVHQALRDYTRSDMLAANPLMRSRLVLETANNTPSPAVLQKLLQDVVNSLVANPKDEKFYHAVHRTYLKPAPSQEAAAELLNLPLGTYRYRLAKGVERIADWLWQRELHDYNN